MWRQVEVIEGLTWTIPCEDGITVTAAQLQHRVPCWGYVFQEAGLPPVPDQALMASAGVEEVRPPAGAFSQSKVFMGLVYFSQDI